MRVCGASVRCPSCSWLAARELVRVGSWFAARHVEGGGWFVSSSLSVPHRRGESFGVVLGRLRDVWRGLRQLRGLARWRARCSVSPLKVLHVSWGAFGWHPHFHVLWFGYGAGGGWGYLLSSGYAGSQGFCSVITI